MIYFDNAATSFPKPKTVLDEMYQYQLKECGNPGRSSHMLARSASKAVVNARLNIAEFFNASNPMNVIFTKNCSEALNLALLGFIKENSHVITSVFEHNSIVRVLEHLKVTKNIDVTYLTPNENGIIYPEIIEKNIKKDTALIALNHANNLTGNVNDIETIGQIAKEKEVKFLVDAAQSAGKIQIDMKKSNIDFLCCPGHKSLFGVQGTGFLIFSENTKIFPLMFGGTGSFSDLTTYINQIPDMYEIGTLNSLGIVGLNAGINFIKKIGIDKISSHENKLVKYLYENLKKRNSIKIYTKKSENYSGILSFNLENHDSSFVSSFLDENAIMIRGGLHCNPLGHRYLGTLDNGVCRVSFSFFNTISEIDVLIEKIDLLIKENYEK